MLSQRIMSFPGADFTRNDQMKALLKSVQVWLIQKAGIFSPKVGYFYAFYFNDFY
jgi:hypothetical protein